MRYLPTLNIWKPVTFTMPLEMVVIKLQRGQWLRCKYQRQALRSLEFLNDRSIWVTYLQGTPENQR